MTSLHDWFQDRLTTLSARMPDEVRVSVTHDQHLGPTWERAGLVLEVGPADEFTVELVGEQAGGDEREYANAAALGFLDVAMVSTPFPLRDVRVRVVELSVDPVASSQMAFRKAGRQAARKVIEELRKTHDQGR
jgi:Elongation factor G, domain IV